MVEKNTGKTKVHTIYRTKDGKRVPGTTTITGILNKPALVPWANKLGLQGIDSRKFVDEKAAIGTLAHYIVECYLKDIEPDLDDYSPNQVDLAENSVLKFYEWEENNPLTNVKCEMELVSEKHRYGGTEDIYAVLHGQNTLIDLKTSKAIYPEMWTQVSAYQNLLEEHGFIVDNVGILRIGRDEDEGFEYKEISKTKLDLHWEKFKHCLKIYEIDKQLRRK